VSDEPLTPLTFQILLALAREDRHGYAIVKAVRETSDGAVNPGTGTFYSALHRMVQEGVIEEVGDDERRRFYRITRTGRSALARDAERLQAWSRSARALLARGER